MSPRELASWEAYLETGSLRMAAIMLGVHEQTVKRHLSLLKEEFGVRTLAQLAHAISATKGVDRVSIASDDAIVRLG